MLLDLKLALNQNSIKKKEANIKIFSNGYTDNIWDIITDTCFLAQVDRKYIAGTDIISSFNRLADCKKFMDHYQKSDFDLLNLKSICIDDFEGYIAVETNLYKGK